MLAELMRFRRGIAVAGTHGKTTTTSLVAELLAAAEMDPTYVIGGRVNNAAGHGRLGQGDYLVAEADESDASFLFLQPVIAIVTNIDADHLGTYDGDFNRLQQTFLEFIHHLPFYGLAVVCADDSVINNMMSEIGRPLLSYGFDSDADIKGENLKISGGQSTFKVSLPANDASKETELDITLNMPGKHNALNALAAIAVAHELGVDGSSIQKALSEFSGVGRRFQRYGEIKVASSDSGTKTIELVDDYGHHPTEVQATIEATRANWPNSRLVVAFQPHRYSRTRDLFEDFAVVLCGVDVLCLAEVYPAGETAIAGADGRALCHAIRIRGKVDPVFIADINQLADNLRSILEDGDILLTLGAGNIGAIAASLPDQLGRES
jgi:UDP-N-acetylmuramate--alanine ligase